MIGRELEWKRICSIREKSMDKPGKRESKSSWNSSNQTMIIRMSEL